MQSRKSGEDSESDRYSLGHAARPSLETIRKRFSRQQLHGEKEVAVLFVDLVDLADVRMIDAGRGARFSPEAPTGRFIAAQRRHRLEGDRAPEPLVTRLVDDAH